MLATLQSELAIAIPASVVSDTPHLREKTAKLGAIARASAVFGVTEIILYPDQNRDQREDMEFCAQLLGYLETPQYLRKRMFKLNPMLKYAGILPPLQIPHHTSPSVLAQVKEGDVREGLVISHMGRGLLVDVGLEKPVSVLGESSVGDRITIRLISVNRDLRGEIAERSKISIYWGYRVTRSKFKLASLLEKERFNLKIGTSRFGTRIQEVWKKLSESLEVESILVAFGSPRMGLKEILAQENRTPHEVFSYYVNTVPNQTVATVRTEEAIFISLGILNAMRR